MSDFEKIEAALEIAFQNGQYDGSHHKMWVIDQMVRALLGTTKKYEKWVKDYQGPPLDDEEDCYDYDWDVGTPP